MQSESEQLTPFAIKVYERLEAIGKDEVWLVSQLRRDGNHASLKQLREIFSGEYDSTAKRRSINYALFAEEERQRLKKIVGIPQR